MSSTDLTPDDQPAQVSEGNERKEDAAGEDGMEVSCNGHGNIPKSESSAEARETEQSTEERKDQQDVSRPESNAETKDTLSSAEERQTCNGSPADPELQTPPASLSPDSVTVELKEEGTHTRGENKSEDKEKEGQNG